jgi:hypothetical protein
MHYGAPGELIPKACWDLGRPSYGTSRTLATHKSNQYQFKYVRLYPFSYSTQTVQNLFRHALVESPNPFIVFE